jgi:hypothetical protein
MRAEVRTMRNKGYKTEYNEIFLPRNMGWQVCLEVGVFLVYDRRINRE